MKKIIVIIPLIFLVLLFLKPGKEYTKISLERDLISEQYKIDQDINSAIDNKNYTVDNPKIIVNPYKISPLTALIIFTTEEEDNYQILVNNVYMGTTTKETKHSIPIYGLLGNKENEVKLINKNKEYVYKIKTTLKEKFDNIKVLKKDKKYNDYLLTSSSTSPLLYSVFNKNGQVVWHLDIESQGVFALLPNGNYLVGTPEYVSGDVSLSTGLYEVNLLGKIVNRYDTPYMYHHDIFVINENEIFVAGNSFDEDKANLSLIYRLNLKTGKIVSYVDFYDVFSRVDKNWDAYSKAINKGYDLNSIDYNEETSELLITFRTLNLIMAYDLKNQKINWLYTNEEYFQEVFKEYIIKSDLNVYPKGAHHARYIDDKTISFYNNNFDFKNKVSDKIQDIDLIGAEAVILKINQEEQRAKIVKQIKEENNKFSYGLGSYVRSNNKDLINYSYLYKDAAFKDKIALWEIGGYTYSHIIYRDKDKVLFEGTIDDRLYRVEKFAFPSNIESYVPDIYTYYNESLSKNINTNELKHLPYYDIELKMTQNGYEVLTSDYMFKNFTLILNGKKIFVVPYLKTKTYYKIVPGRYNLYAYIDGKYYNLYKYIEIAS